MVKNKKCQLCFFVILTFIISFIPIKKVQAINDLCIISKTSINKEDAKKWAKSKDATEDFVNLADLYWTYYDKNGQVNPAIAYVQSAIETGYGKFGGVIDSSYHNPCGLKTAKGGENNDPNAHQRFENWQQGVQAHLDHLALYAGAEGYPRENTYDPRHFPSIKGTAKTVNSLSGKWASDNSYGTNILRLYTELLKASAPKPNIIEIESPKDNHNVNYNEKTLRISGWSINATGVESIKVYVDGKLKGDAKIGIPRADVGKIYPNNPGSDNSGFLFDLNTDNLSTGNRKVTVEQVAKDGNIIKKDFTINLKEKEPFIGIDIPINNDIISSKDTMISGWAINKSGVKQVNIYVDETYKGKADIGHRRDDIGKAYPDYINSNNSGYTFNLNFSDVAPGRKKITIEQIGNDNTKLKKHINVELRKKEYKLAIDEPGNNLAIGPNQYKTVVSGWALNDSGIKEIKVYVDGHLKGNAKIGYERKDIGQAFPDYMDSDKSGYRYELNLKNVAPGKRNITVEQIGKDGSSYSKDVVIQIKKKESKIAIDEPSNLSSIGPNKYTAIVSGWALNDSGIKEIKVYVDGHLKGNAKIGHERKDIGQAFPDYIDSDKSGYRYELNLKDVPPGKRNVTVQQIGKDGSVYAKDVVLDVKKKECKIAIDEPSNLSSIGPNKYTAIVSGWALNDSGIKEIKVYVDGHLKGNAKIGHERKDIGQAFPDYIDSDKSGYRYELNLKDVPPGKRNVTVQQIGKDGSVYAKDVVLDVKKKEAKIAIDSPNDNMVIDPQNKTIHVSGWALNDAGVKEVNIYVNNQFKKKADYGYERKDIGKAFPEYTNSTNSGFVSNIDLSNLPRGNHVLVVEVVGIDGSKSTKNLRVRNSALIVVDPGHNYGGDSGAQAFHDGKEYREQDLSLQISLRLKTELEKIGYSVVLTREAFDRPTDSLETSIANRVNLANDLNADLFVSIHLDSSNTIMAKGVSTFYSSYKPGLDNTDIVKGKDPNGYDWYDFEMDLTPTPQAIKGKELAKNIVNNLSRDGKYENRREHDRGLGVTKRTNMPAVLTECGYITNESDAKKAASVEGQTQIAKSIATSISKVF